MSHTKSPEVIMLEHQLDVEDLKKPTELLAITDRIPLPAEIAHLTREEQERLERNVVRKMDYRLMPIVVLMFWLNILDRNSIANAKIAGLTEDLNMTNSEYNTVLMIFYVGYILTQLPSNAILPLVRPSWYLPLVTCAWGLVSMSQGFLHNFRSIMAVRFFIGVVEGPFLPGLIFLLSCWYKKEELGKRIAFLYAGNILSSCFGGLIAAGIIGGMDDVAGYASWRWLFIIEGAATVVVGICAIPLFPDYPRNTRWLSTEEQLFAEWRLSNEVAGIVDEDESGVWWGVGQALRDPMTYLFTFMQMMLTTGQSITYFLPSVMKTLGKSNVVTLLLTAPPYAVAFMGSVAVAFSSAHFNERCLHIAVPLVSSLIGNIMAMTVPGFGLRYFSIFLMLFGVYSVYNVNFAWVSSSIPRPRAKRAASLAIVNLMSAGVTHLYTSYLFPDGDKPRYYMGGSVLTVAIFLCGATAVAIRFYLVRLNRKIDRMGGHAESAVHAASGGTLTQKAFKFTL
ncbi:hypothetical protein PV04_06612 [Phialophora macrospora]|uniref:Major facilitator superfamily (MFS) profile domain-containing protein n=1 Tax=Phialophora macrospora TaxID=1851006 RepID=A0A0D2CQD3_9EURO|nr:hypothetical protein PV04_06612 [Phialophora macrospora]